MGTRHEQMTTLRPTKPELMTHLQSILPIHAPDQGLQPLLLYKGERGGRRRKEKVCVSVSVSVRLCVSDSSGGHTHSNSRRNHAGGRKRTCGVSSAIQSPSWPAISAAPPPCSRSCCSSTCSSSRFRCSFTGAQTERERESVCVCVCVCE